jgi:arginine decarboxylase-like protein
MTLNTKIDLLKLNDSPDTTLETSLSSITPAESNLQSSDAQNMYAETLIDVSDQKDSSLNNFANGSVDAARDKVKKLEILLAKCKDAIKIHKEKVKEYSTENEQLKTDLLTSEVNIECLTEFSIVFLLNS